MFDNSRKKAKVCFHWKNSYCFEICVFNNLPRVIQLALQLTQWMPEDFVQPNKLFLDFCRARLYEKNYVIYLLIGKTVVSLKNAYRPPIYFKNRSYNLHDVFQTTLWTRISWSLRFVILDNTRKNWPIFCSTQRKHFFWNVFSTPF